MNDNENEEAEAMMDEALELCGGYILQSLISSNKLKVS